MQSLQSGGLVTEAEKSISMVTGPAAAVEASVCIDAVGVCTAATVITSTLVHICVRTMSWVFKG